MIRESAVFSSFIDTPPNHSLATEFSIASDTKDSLREKVDEMSEMLEDMVSKSDLQALELNLKKWIENELKEYKEETSKNLSIHELQAKKMGEINSKLIETKSYIKSIAAEVAEFKQKLREEVEEMKSWVEGKLQDQYNMIMKDKEDLLKGIKELRSELKLTERESAIEDKLKEIKGSFNQQIHKLEKLNVKAMNSLAGSLKKEFNERYKESDKRMLTSEENYETFSKRQSYHWETIRAIYDNNCNIRKTITEKMIQFSSQLETIKNTLISNLGPIDKQTIEGPSDDFADFSSRDRSDTLAEILTETNHTKSTRNIEKNRSPSISVQSDSSEYKDPLGPQNIEEEEYRTQITRKDVNNVAEIKHSLNSNSGEHRDNLFNANTLMGNKNSKEGLMSNNTISSTGTEQTIVAP